MLHFLPFFVKITLEVNAVLDSLFEHYDNIVVLDTETTGINHKTDEIIELAAVRATPNGIEDEMDLFIKLSPGRSLPPVITELTGITEQMLTDEGVEKREACERFCQMLSHPRTLLAAFNAQFDFCFLYYFLAPFSKAHMLKNMGLFDIMTVYKDRREYPHKLKNAIEAYGVEAVNSHRAVDDTKAALLVMEAMRLERDDLMRYRNLFGYHPKYGVSGPQISSVRYLPQGYNRTTRLYEDIAPENVSFF